MSKVIKSIKLTDNLTTTECNDGYWLYDYTRGMNLSMIAKTQEDAFVEAITYYQERTKQLESDLKKFDDATRLFINSISDEENECYC